MVRVCVWEHEQLSIVATQSEAMIVKNANEIMDDENCLDFHSQQSYLHS